MWFLLPSHWDALRCESLLLLLERKDTPLEGAHGFLTSLSNPPLRGRRRGPYQRLLEICLTHKRTVCIPPASSEWPLSL